MDAVTSGQPTPTSAGPVHHQESIQTLLANATEFLDNVWSGMDREVRLAEVEEEIRTSGTYTHTAGELVAGCRQAWANSARCIGRLHVPALRVRDRRSSATAGEVARECVEHIRQSTNNGKLQPTVTVFPARTLGGDQIRLWNSQLIRYAGYHRPDGSVVGDPVNADLTAMIRTTCDWTGRGGRFDVLPLVVQLPGAPPRAFDIPRDAVLEVEIEHPAFSWFADLGLRWYALPAICDMDLVIGGIVYTAVFSGWYMDTEIGVRDFGDPLRYNMLPVVAERMGLDSSTNQSLWRDRALIELDHAVLFSFRRAGVRMVDHHTAADQFARYLAREEKDGRPVPADWAWLVPPMAGNTMDIFHREFPPVDESLRPNFVRPQHPAWQPAGQDVPGPRCPFGPF